MLTPLRAAVTSALLWPAGGLQRHGEHEGEILQVGRASELRGPEGRGRGELVVVSWNIAYARGPEPEGARHRRWSRAEVHARARALGQLLARQGADIVLLQEVDFASRRSGYVDQLPQIAEAAGLDYGARALSWRVRWLPYPYWPPTRHHGPVVSGGGVLSRFPIERNRVITHPKPPSGSRVYYAFAPFYYTQLVQVRVGASALWVANNHLEPWRRGAREIQARRLVALLGRLERDDPSCALLVAGGDLNSVPPESPRKHGFADDPRDDYRDDETIAMLRALAGVVECQPQPRPGSARALTYPALLPDRRLDHLFAGSGARPRSCAVADGAQLSDHLPVRAELELVAG